MINVYGYGKLLNVGNHFGLYLHTDSSFMSNIGAWGLSRRHSSFAVSPVFDLTEISTNGDRSNISRILALSRSEAAMCNGVRPPFVCAFISAPQLKRISPDWREFHLAALCKGCQPSAVWADTSAL